MPQTNRSSVFMVSPRIWFDRHAKFGCRLSYCVCVHVTDPKNFGDAGAPPSWDGDVANP